MGDFTKLAVWHRAHAVTIAMHHETARWPKHELFGLVSQARRAAVSISANIAEGCGKNSDAELARHSQTSLGSASELSYYVTLAHDLVSHTPNVRCRPSLDFRSQTHARVVGGCIRCSRRAGRSVIQAASEVAAAY